MILYKKRRTENNEVKELPNQNCVLEVNGRRVLWLRIDRNKMGVTKTKEQLYGRAIVYDVKYNKLCKISHFKDRRRVSKYYYDWGTIDRKIYKYFYEKAKYRLGEGYYVEAIDLPDYIVDIRNDIIETLFNLVNTIIYTHSFHQQLDDDDLFQDSAEKLIMLLDNDKHDPLRGTSFTFFTIALKNMIFTQLKKQKQLPVSIEDYPEKMESYCESSANPEQEFMQSEYERRYLLD